MKQTPLGLWYPDDEDDPDGPTQIGELAKGVDDLLQKGGVAGHAYQDAAVTRTSGAFGSFSTPIKVGGLNYKAGQLLEVVIAGFVKSTGGPTSGILRLAVQAGTLILPMETEMGQTAGQYFAVASGTYDLLIGEEALGTGVSYPRPIALGAAPIYVDPKGSDGTVEVELQAKIQSGGATVTMEKTHLLARVWG